MKATITRLKAPWPEGAAVGDVVEFDGAVMPDWAVGKCTAAPDDAAVTAGGKAESEAVAKKSKKG